MRRAASLRAPMQTLPGFRDFFPDDCARRNYILDTWRAVSRRYGFTEYDGPVVESLALYEKKSGGELVGQLFTVGALADPGAAKGALRPEMTPTLARMVAARADRTVFVDAADKAKYGLAVQVMDAARGAGATTVGILTEKAK